MSKWPGDARKQSTTFGTLSRSELMSLVKSTRNATTEERLASLLRRAKITAWRRHQRILGRPDFVWRESRLAVFVDGCFWHGHDCGRKLTPETNAQVWREKIERNKTRDGHVTRELRRAGWSVYRIWECELARNADRSIKRIRVLLANSRTAAGLAGK